MQKRIGVVFVRALETGISESLQLVPCQAWLGRLKTGLKNPLPIPLLAAIASNILSALPWGQS
jgi:hypothetical protein